jgi:hypothetical protein
METGRTALSALQEGKIWRVQIVWPNGVLHYFGKFITEQGAIEWIAAHSWWLTAPATDEATDNPPITGQAQSSK